LFLLIVIVRRDGWGCGGWSCWERTPDIADVVGIAGSWTGGIGHASEWCSAVVIRGGIVVLVQISAAVAIVVVNWWEHVTVRSFLRLGRVLRSLWWILSAANVSWRITCPPY